jgi:hypothetical protein
MRIFTWSSNLICMMMKLMRIIISTLWAKILLKDAYLTERYVSDFHRILYNGETLTWDNFNREHDKCFSFIQDEVAKSTAEHLVVVTHHVPSFQLASPDFSGSKINGAFTFSPLIHYTKHTMLPLIHYKYHTK